MISFSLRLKTFLRSGVFGGWAMLKGLLRMEKGHQIIGQATAGLPTPLEAGLAGAVKRPKPVFIGDTLHATSEVIGLRPSKSRPETGIVTFLHEAINQRGEVVCRCERSALLKKAEQA